MRLETAKADPVTLTLPGTVSVQAGSSVTVIGTLANEGAPSFSISSWTITLGSALLTFDDTGFQGSPLVLNSGDAFGPTGFFDIFANIALAPGTYTGSFTVFDTTRELGVTRDFRINVTAGQAVPELALLGTGLAGYAAARRWKRVRQTRINKRHPTGSSAVPSVRGLERPSAPGAPALRVPISEFGN